MDYVIESTSHEFPIMSWWAAHASGSKNVQMVDEESGHRPVWGLSPGEPSVSVPYKKKQIKAHAKNIGDPVGTSQSPAQLVRLVLTLPSGIKMADIMAVAKEEYNSVFGSIGVHIYYTRKYSEEVYWRDYGVIPPRSISSVKLADNMELEILADARQFIKDEPDYIRLGRPYKRVYCLYGKPGTGKTSLCTAIASELGRPLAIFNTDSLRDDTFIELMTNRPTNAVLMFEDVDALFRGRQISGEDQKGGGNGEGGMTFSTLLNVLDGVLHPRGALIFLTTNHLERLDSALRRPGRVDRLIELKLSTGLQAMEMWKTVFPKTPPPPGLTKLRGVSPAQLSEVLFQRRHDTPQVAMQAIEALQSSHYAEISKPSDLLSKPEFRKKK